jgi:DNA-binding winged helix-turn-helix (wHTH) protein/TolB-like protein
MKFGEFEIDEAAGEIRRNGARVKLQDLPFRLLVVLLRRPGEVVTRDEVRAELWGAETFVDAEAGLNTAIAKLREALGDNAETPRFIETLPKRGYRFVGMPPTAKPAGAPWGRLALAGLAIVVMVVAAYLAFRGPARIPMAVVRFHNETGVAENDRLAGSLTDAAVVSLAGDARYGVIGNSPLLRTERIFQDVGTIGNALRVDYVVLGQLQTGDRGLLARLHFIRVSDGTHLWAGKVEVADAPDFERALTRTLLDGVATGLAKKQ